MYKIFIKCNYMARLVEKYDYDYDSLEREVMVQSQTYIQIIYPKT